MSSREEVRDAFNQLGEAVTFLGTALFDRFDQIIALLSFDRAASEPEDIETPPSKIEVETPRKARNGSNRQPPPAADVRTFDPYTTINAVKIVRLLAREDVRAIGKITKSIADELQLSEGSTKRLINVITEGLPFLLLTKRGGSHSLRIKPGQYDDAAAWLARVNAVESAGKHDFGNYRCADEAYAIYAPRIVRALLQGDRTTKDIYDETSVRPHTFRGVMNRLMPEGFIHIPVAPRGSAPLLQVIDRDRAQRWLSNHTNAESNGTSRASPLS